MWTLCILQSSYYEGELLIAAPWETGMEFQGENVETDSGKTPTSLSPRTPTAALFWQALPFRPYYI